MVIPTKNLLNHDYLIGNFIGNSAQSAKTKNSETLDNEAFRSFAGGATRNRTGDTRIFSPLLYQLSYGTVVFASAKI